VILLDTNVVSELMKEEAAPAVERWFASVGNETALPAGDDELVEVTPKVVRIRKRFLDPHERKRQSRKAEAA